MTKSKLIENKMIICYIIVRESLCMSIGKTAGQVGHAVQYLFQKYIDEYRDLDDTRPMKFKCSIFERWIKDCNSTKIVLGANENEWAKIKLEMKDCLIVKDAGKTELDPGTETVIILWPMGKEAVPKLIKRLQLLNDFKK